MASVSKIITDRDEGKIEQDFIVQFLFSMLLNPMFVCLCVFEFPVQLFESIPPDLFTTSGRGAERERKERMYVLYRRKRIKNWPEFKGAIRPGETLK